MVFSVCKAILWDFHLQQNDSSVVNGKGGIGDRLFCFIGNSDLFRKQKKHAFTKVELDKRVRGNGNKTMVRLEDIKTFFTKQIVKRIVFI